MPALLQPYTWAIVLGGFAMWTGYCVRWGDVHGFNAREIARIEAELARTNLRLQTFTAADDATAVKDDELRNQGYTKALDELKQAGGICIVTPEMAAALNRVAQ